ncbi:M81 family metallopeptidase [Persicitalea jodogahamensis]|nr:M81 family metallopeptidase [Persicitalea jodogahamensis]
MRKRVALLGIYHETNTFIDVATTLDDFKNGYWLERDAIRAEYQGAHHEISGVIEVIDASPDVDLVPVFYAMATPGGIISDETYEAIRFHMMAMLDDVLPVEGCIVVPHGAGVTPTNPDMDGHWLGALREKLGSNIPIIGTLDPHANVSPEMVLATDFLIPYRTNPHIDQFATGCKAAEVMLKTLCGDIKPAQKLFQLPLAISIEQQNTNAHPCKGFYEYAHQLQTEYQLLSAGILLGFPYADVKEMGSALIIASQNNSSQETENIENAGHALREYALVHLQDFDGKKVKIDSVLSDLLDAPKPVLALDIGDNVGGGAPGDSTYLLEYFEKKNIDGVFICLYHPESVKQCLNYQTGDTVKIDLGETDKTYPVEVTLQFVTAGVFQEDTPKHGGFVNYDMGTIAVVKTLLGNTIMLTTKRTPPYSIRQLTAFGLAPIDFNFIVAKGVNAPIAAYSSVCPTIAQLDTPGVTQADMTLFPYKHRRRPLFPFEKVVA